MWQGYISKYYSVSVQFFPLLLSLAPHRLFSPPQSSPKHKDSKKPHSNAGQKYSQAAKKAGLSSPKNYTRLRRRKEERQREEEPKLDEAGVDVIKASRR